MNFGHQRELGENGGVDVSIKCKKLIEFLLSFRVEKLPMGPMICVGGYSCLLVYFLLDFSLSLNHFGLDYK